MGDSILDYLKKLIKNLALIAAIIVGLFFVLILILQTRYGYLHASEINKTNIPQINAYSQCRLVGVHRDYNGQKYVRYCVYRCQDSSLEYLEEPDHRGGCELDKNKILIKT
tara:strand:+ start:1500 stop:1832 length:333 start_codon:yes stop_codon:yes gene_type:complete